MKLFDATSKICNELFIRMPDLMFSVNNENTICVTHNDNYLEPIIYTIKIHRTFPFINNFILNIYNGTASERVLMTLKFKSNNEGILYIDEDYQPF